jgi:vancomycin resistance protein YoaR
MRAILISTIVCGAVAAQVPQVNQVREYRSRLEPRLPESEIPAPEVPVQPAQPLPANAPTMRPLELLIVQTEPELQNGRLIEVRSERRLRFPTPSVNISRARQQASNGIEETLQQWATNLKQAEASDARFYRIQGAWIARQRSEWQIDLPATRAAVQNALRNNTITVTASLRKTPPKRSVNDLYRQGIRNHFGSGSSSFAGSPSYRVQNIIAAAKQLDAQYLPRNATFNFNSSIRLNSQSGFVLGNIIRGQNLSKELGGGICQVSSTVWRAAYNAGLPILERHQHSYRVAYYDPPGFEATVFAPSKNLRFGNDTQAALWIQLEWDTKAGTLEMHLFGVRPERKTQISDPRISDERPAPKDRFVPDPNLKPGDVQILSGAEQGMKTRIERIVRYNTGQVRRDTTQSRYVPWGAIYALNPSDPRIKNGRRSQ